MSVKTENLKETIFVFYIYVLWFLSAYIMKSKLHAYSVSDQLKLF